MWDIDEIFLQSVVWECICCNGFQPAGKCNNGSQLHVRVNTQLNYCIVQVRSNSSRSGLEAGKRRIENLVIFHGRVVSFRQTQAQCSTRIQMDVKKIEISLDYSMSRPQCKVQVIPKRRV